MTHQNAIILRVSYNIIWLITDYQEAIIIILDHSYVIRLLCIIVILFGTALIIVVIGVIVIDYIIILMVKFGLANHRIEKKNFRAIKIQCIFTNYSSQNQWGLIRTFTLQIMIVYKL